MNLEIERKFLVDTSKMPDKKGAVQYITQGYPNGYRVRIVSSVGGRNYALLTIKKRISNLTSKEFEYEIPIEDANALLEGLPVIRKRREYYGDWSVDFFNDFPFVIAEIELTSEGEKFIIPDWCYEEVTHDDSYRNCNLIKQLEV